MDLNIRHKTALITGASRGLGRAIALALAEEGVHVAFVARSAQDMDSLREELQPLGVRHIGLVQDLASEDSIPRLIHSLSSAGWPVFDILIHNVGGTLDITDPFCKIADWKKVFRLNFDVSIELNHHYLPLMKERKWGRVIHVSSISSMESHGPIPYCAAKAALNAYTRSMGRMVAKDGVIVVAILPGAVWTKNGYWDTVNSGHLEKYLEQRMAIGRLGQPDEIAKAVAFFCSEHASFCVGSIIPIDGGQGRSYFGE
ncbi:3-oxoacyl-[acyl-carrier protein] reductase [Verrucomicrobium sp. GAS474]|uniref:SDR family NAD(P)-dependent oxidoreductase n=1 Tax=Verrucomicrobium sp. GAS474 TaxID=1882831 RepID=UPI00087B1C41|nr:SDR family oxidoreductase [Verrucomicrobium sp. GAS474]SDT94545.1 3-oxoacyl-[acyl-carrier protein] reductase [Verrucomicrobium sp. GAS474]